MPRGGHHGPVFRPYDVVESNGVPRDNVRVLYGPILSRPYVEPVRSVRLTGEIAAGEAFVGPIGRHVQVRDGGQGWSDSQVITSLVLLNPSMDSGQALAGGESVDDLRLLEKDEGFCRVLRRAKPRP